MLRCFELSSQLGYGLAESSVHWWKLWGMTGRYEVKLGLMGMTVMSVGIALSLGVVKRRMGGCQLRRWECVVGSVSSQLVVKKAALRWK